MKHFPSFLFLFFLITSCSEKKDKETCSAEHVESLVFELPEVQVRNRFLDSLTHHKKGVSFITTQEEIEKKPYYSIQVGYSSAERFETYYTFYVDKNDCQQIRVMDVITGDILPLEEWRAPKNQPAELCFSDPLELPFKSEMLSPLAKYPTTSCSIAGLEEFLCGESALRYHYLGTQADVDILLVPMDCGDFYLFQLLTIKNNAVVSHLQVSGEWSEPDQEETYATRNDFVLQKDFTLEVTTSEYKSNKKTSEKIATYSIQKSGTIDLVKTDQVEIDPQETNKSLEHLLFSNGGLTGFYSDGSVVGCPKCDLLKVNISKMARSKPLGTYKREENELILTNKQAESERFDLGSPEEAPDRWAIKEGKVLVPFE